MNDFPREPLHLGHFLTICYSLQLLPSVFPVPIHCASKEHLKKILSLEWLRLIFLRSFTGWLQ